MSFGALLRCDAGGGLGSISLEIARWLRPDRVLLVDLHDRGRGPCVPRSFDYPESDIYRTDWAGSFNGRALDWITSEGIDTLLSLEVWYEGQELAGAGLLSKAHNNGIRSIVYAMPELAPWTHRDIRPRPHTFLVPTGWRLDTMPPGTEVLPMPVARDRLPFRRPRDECRAFYHVAASAMLDRAGTEIVLAALPFVTEQCSLTIRAERPVKIPQCKVQVDVIDRRDANYWETVPPGTDVLLSPRRYGGLNLPLQECASLGVPSLMLDSDPYACYGFAHAIPTRGSRPAAMKGGMVPVFDADPRVLAAKIDQLVRDPERNVAAAWAADAWAETHSWDGPLGARWCAMLSAGCAEAAA